MVVANLIIEKVSLPVPHLPFRFLLFPAIICISRTEPEIPRQRRLIMSVYVTFPCPLLPQWLCIFRLFALVRVVVVRPIGQRRRLIVGLEQQYQAINFQSRCLTTRYCLFRCSYIQVVIDIDELRGK